MWIASFLLYLSSSAVNSKLTCISEDGGPVDMFILYKLPEITWYDVPPVVKSGKGYVYLDSNDTTFKLGKIPIGHEDSPAGRTLNQVYKKYHYFNQYTKLQPNKGPGDIDDMAHIFYNDANPEGEEFFTNGHTKGALAFDKESGFWLISSVPRYPNRADDGYGYPHSGFRYAQLMMCITFDSQFFNEIGLQLLYNNPHVHDSHLPKTWVKNYPNLQKTISGKHINKPPFFNVAEFKSLGGTRYQHFAKSVGFEKDLYHDLVAPYLKSNLLTETWQHGKNIGPSCNGSHTVLDVLNLNITVEDAYFSFRNFNDHSKFAISDSKLKPFVCIGDINRQPSQFHRGGGTMCIENIELWKIFRRIVLQTTRCGSVSGMDYEFIYGRRM